MPTESPKTILLSLDDASLDPTSKLFSAKSLDKNVTSAPPCKKEEKACNCGVTEEDKVVALVMTKRGGFRGRRINAKAIEKIMQNKVDNKQMDDLKAGKSIQVSVNNSYVLPAGRYYFPHPVRIAGFMSP